MWRPGQGSPYPLPIMKSSVLLAIPTFLAALCSIHTDQVDDYLKVQMKQHRIPGIALRIIQEKHVTKTGTYGVANLELNVPVKPETVFEIGSITKQFHCCWHPVAGS